MVVNVTVPDVNYPYDFAWNYCDATWKGGGLTEEEETVVKLPCPSSPSSASGFVVLQSSPVMEHRPDDELTLWVHPFDVRYGWIKGIYPDYTVQAGDHFKAWVGCMDDMKKCSIDFRLSYIDEFDVDHLIGTWYEEYDGQASEIDIDLDALGLTGRSVNFVLETVAMTHNTDKANGFWFVPRIDRP